VARQRQEARRAEGPGWFTTLAGALVLVVVGFGIGFASGAIFEEPGLLMQHLTGRTQSLPLAAQAALPSRASPSVAQSPASAPALPPPANPPSAVASPPPVAAAPPVRPDRRAPTGRFVVQVGAFGSRASAQELVRSLASSGLTANVAEGASGAVRYKVRVGPVATREEAEALALRLKREKQLPTWVMARDRD
jgi:cell division protein FtsN